jgi:hypothetical protein
MFLVKTVLKMLLYVMISYGRLTLCQPGSVSGFQNQTGGPNGYGTSLFRFARKLVTGDDCDHPILNATTMDVLYAMGYDNTWRKHYAAGVVELQLIPGKCLLWNLEIFLG